MPGLAGTFLVDDIEQFATAGKECPKPVDHYGFQIACWDTSLRNLADPERKSELGVYDLAIGEKFLPSGFILCAAALLTRIAMSGVSLDGKIRSKLREVILAGYNPVALDETLRDNDMFRHNVASGPDFVTRVNSLIDVAHQEGWLVELCGVLAAARAGNQNVSAAILAVQKSLIEKRETRDIDLQFQSHAGLLPDTNAARSSSQNQSAPDEISWAEFLFSFKGRLSRRSFWLGFVIIVIVAASMNASLGLLLGEAAFELQADASVPTRLYKNIYWLMGILLYWPLFALIVKRLHDFGQGKALAWTFFVLSVIHKISDVTGPEVLAMVTLAIFMTVLVVLGSVKGIPGSNEYGPDPLIRQRQRPP